MLWKVVVKTLKSERIGHVRETTWTLGGDR